MALKRIKKAKGQVKYTTMQGETKSTYRMMGYMLKDDEGQVSLALDTMPIGDGFTGRVFFYDLDDEQKQAPAPAAPAPAPEIDDDEIPFD